MSVLRAALVDLRPLGIEAPVAPRLPTLERLLARADASDGPRDWRRHAAGAWLTPPATGHLPVAATIASAAGLDPAVSWYVATPLHLTAGLNFVRQHPAGALVLDPARAALLSAAHAQDFAGTGSALVATAYGLLWHGPPAAVPDTVDPDPYTGQDIEPALPGGEGAAELRRHMTELQMWLHALPASGAGLAPNALWLWGAAAVPALVPTRRPLLASGDAFLRALDALARPRPAAPDEVATIRLSDLGRDGDAFALAEAGPFAALAQRVAAGRDGRVELWFGGRTYRLRRVHGLRFWRTPRPWWQGESP